MANAIARVNLRLGSGLLCDALLSERNSEIVLHYINPRCGDSELHLDTLGAAAGHGACRAVKKNTAPHFMLLIGARSAHESEACSVL
jgi:hypothetical protein